jgi:glycosyltransferase involved in cell wall biosynthesis
MLAQNAIWLPRAWSACKQMVAEHRPDAVLSSGPPHCVHVLGHYLKRRTGLPWVADFRDPWISDGSNRRLGWFDRWERRWERRVFANADLVLGNAPNATRLYQRTYPESSDRIMTLTNGFDRAGPTFALTDPDGTIRLLHAGEIYAGRDPRPLFEALMQLNQPGDQTYQLAILGRNDCDLDGLLRERGWTDFVTVEGQSSYQESLDEMARADILVLFDSPGRTIGVPAKVYEYLRAGRPILALAEPDGDTAAILRTSGVLHRIVPPRDVERIRQALAELAAAMGTTEAVGDPSRLEQFTRERIAETLAGRLDSLVGAASVPSRLTKGIPDSSRHVSARG